jgi:prepilin-type processing-associated H-X9-DG protein
LLELVGVLLILGILTTLLAPLYKSYRLRAESLHCVSNLKALGLGVQAYMEDHRSWPQIAPERAGGKQGRTPQISADDNSHAGKWIAALKPYGISPKIWRCPSIERTIKAEGKPEALNMNRVDYVATTFDSRPESPRQYPKHPWFMERGNLHPTGPNILFADGSVANPTELLKPDR